ncbi:MAG: DUF3993 domain-containing protein [Bacillaceae bacterium]
MNKFIRIAFIAMSVLFLFLFSIGETKGNFDKEELINKAQSVEKIQLFLHSSIESFDSIYKKFGPYFTEQFLQAYVNENAYLVEGVYRWKKVKPLLVPRIDKEKVQFYENEKHRVIYMYQRISKNRYQIITYQLEKNSWKISGVLVNTQLPPEIKKPEKEENSFWDQLTKNLKAIRLFN